MLQLFERLFRRAPCCKPDCACDKEAADEAVQIAQSELRVVGRKQAMLVKALTDDMKKLLNETLDKT